MMGMNVTLSGCFDSIPWKHEPPSPLWATQLASMQENAERRGLLVTEDLQPCFSQVARFLGEASGATLILTPPSMVVQEPPSPAPLPLGGLNVEALRPLAIRPASGLEGPSPPPPAPVNPLRAQPQLMSWA